VKIWTGRKTKCYTKCACEHVYSSGSDPHGLRVCRDRDPCSRAKKEKEKQNTHTHTHTNSRIELPAKLPDYFLGSTKSTIKHSGEGKKEKEREGDLPRWAYKRTASQKSFINDQTNQILICELFKINYMLDEPDTGLNPRSGYNQKILPAMHFV